MKSGELIDGKKKKNYNPNWLLCEATIKLM